MTDGERLADIIRAERARTTRDLRTPTWGFGMQGAMFMVPGHGRSGISRPFDLVIHITRVY